MKKFLATFICALLITPTVYAEATQKSCLLNWFRNDEKQIKSLLNSQVRYANRYNFDKFIATYDKNYINADGFDLDLYSILVKDIWQAYDNIKYAIDIKDISIQDNIAVVKVTESSAAELLELSKMDGSLTSIADSVYLLKKTNGKWKVASDKVLKETTSMLYGDLKNIDVSLVAPQEISAGEEYTASLEFKVPEDVVAVASISRDKVEYPQKQPEEVYRKMPDDNLLERLFVSNSDNVNEYVIATIGLTRADIDELNIKLSLTGYGYKMVRVNVIPDNGEGKNEQNK